MPKVLNARHLREIPPGAIYVGRPRTGKWDLSKLTGHDLVCWCHDWDGTGPNPKQCHADILLERANRKESCS